MSSEYFSSCELMSDPTFEFWNVSQHTLPVGFHEASMIKHSTVSNNSGSFEPSTFHLISNNTPSESASSFDCTGYFAVSPPAHPSNPKQLENLRGCLPESWDSSRFGDHSNSQCPLSGKSSDFLLSEMHGPVNAAIIAPKITQRFENDTNISEEINMQEFLQFCQRSDLINAQISTMAPCEDPFAEITSCEEYLFKSNSSKVTDMFLLDELKEIPTNLQARLQWTSTVFSSIDHVPTKRSCEAPIPCLQEVTKKDNDEIFDNANVVRSRVSVNNNKRWSIAGDTSFIRISSKRTSKKHRKLL